MDLGINRSFQNKKFSNWRLGPGFVRSRCTILLPQAVELATTSNATDYITIRASVTCNHLSESTERLWLITKGPGGGTGLLEVLPSPGPTPVLHCTAVLPVVPLPVHLSLAGACLDASLAYLTRQQQDILLVSCGRGDLRVVFAGHSTPFQQTPAHPPTSTLVSEPVWPLREHAPLLGVRPLRLEAAWLACEGDVLCVAWAVRCRTEAAPAACEVFLIRLSVTTPQPSTADLVQAPQLLVSSVQLLASSPQVHSVIPSPSGKEVLLGLDPVGMVLHQEQEVLGTDSVAGVTVAEVTLTKQSQGGVGVDADMEHIECRQLPTTAMLDDDGNLDPRSLEDAAARLAAYTSEVQAGPLPPEQWTDLYKESGAEDVSADVSCEFVKCTLGVGTAVYLSCGAHKVLSTETPSLIAVTDDVDAVVVQVGWQQEPGPVCPHVQHVSTIPALAYVVASKTQKKHLLIGAPGSRVAAVMVEGTKFVYLYGNVPVGDEYGEQQVIDLGLDGEERVLGARLVSGSAWAGSNSGESVLVIATQRRLLVFQLA